MPIEPPAPRPAPRIANRLMLCAALLLSAAACSKAPDNPGGPGRAAPKTAAQQGSLPADPPAGIVRIPASPADNSGAPVLPRRPSRIWI